MLLEFKTSMMSEFDMTNMGSISYFLRIEVIQKLGRNLISKKRYALEVLQMFGMMESNTITSPIVSRSKIGKDKYSVTFDKLVTNKL